MEAKCNDDPVRMLMMQNLPVSFYQRFEVDPENIHVECIGETGINVDPAYLHRKTSYPNLKQHNYTVIMGKYKLQATVNVFYMPETTPQCGEANTLHVVASLCQSPDTIGGEINKKNLFVSSYVYTYGHNEVWPEVKKDIIQKIEEMKSLEQLKTVTKVFTNLSKKMKGIKCEDLSGIEAKLSCFQDGARDITEIECTVQEVTKSMLSIIETQIRGSCTVEKNTPAFFLNSYWLTDFKEALSKMSDELVGILNEDVKDTDERSQPS